MLKNEVVQGTCSSTFYMDVVAACGWHHVGQKRVYLVRPSGM